MATRCGKCGNEVPDWASGRCPICFRMEQEHIRYGDSLPDRKTSHSPAKSSIPQLKPRVLSGVWKNNDGSVILNFSDGIYEHRMSRRPMTRPLTVLGKDLDEFRLEIGGALIRAWVDVNGGLVLKRNTTMKFLCWSEGKLHKLCPKCLYLSPNKRSSCVACGHVWPV